MILDLFAGPGGWSEGLRMLGREDIGIEWDAAACATRQAAGHRTIRADVAAYPTAPFEGRVEGLIASPPCQAFSTAGKMRGSRDLPRLYEHIAACRGGWVPVDADGWHDPRSPLVLQVLRWTDALRPVWVACEQVPGCLPLWREIGHVLSGWGYATWAGVLEAERYGVPQTRERALLLASRGGPVGPPTPTHQRYVKCEPRGYGCDGLLGRLKPWVSMADALGWAAADWKLRLNSQERAAIRDVGEPSSTVFLGHASNKATWVYERPATTIVGSFRPDVVAAPGWRGAGDGPRQNADGSVPVQQWELGVLQGFPADYPWQGNKSKQGEQVGNAVPPPLAAAVLAPLLGVNVERAA